MYSPLRHYTLVGDFGSITVGHQRIEVLLILRQNVSVDIKLKSAAAKTAVCLAQGPYNVVNALFFVDAGENC